MAFNNEVDDEHWDNLQHNLDYLFNKMSTIDNNQAQMNEQLDLNSKIVNQTVHDQVTLSKQIAESGRTMAQLRLDKAKESTFDVEDSPKSTTSYKGNKFGTHKHHFTDGNPWGTVEDTSKPKDASFTSMQGH
jgi:hypothetical protein